MQESKIGLAVGKLRVHKAKAVADLAKEVVKHWKTAVEKAKARATPTATPAAAADKKTGGATPVTPGGAGAMLRTAKTDGVKAATGDTTRDRCVEMIYDALACDATAREFCFLPPFLPLAGAH